MLTPYVVEPAGGVGHARDERVTAWRVAASSCHLATPSETSAWFGIFGCEAGAPAPFLPVPGCGGGVVLTWGWWRGSIARGSTGGRE